MSSFEELALPSEETSSAVYRGMWFVVIKYLTATNKGILTSNGDGIEQAQLGGDNSKFYFDNEIQAHSVSALYYTNNGFSYPYTVEWEAAKTNEFNKNAVAGAGTLSEPQVMDFI